MFFAVFWVSEFHAVFRNLSQMAQAKTPESLRNLSKQVYANSSSREFRRNLLFFLSRLLDKDGTNLQELFGHPYRQPDRR